MVYRRQDWDVRNNEVVPKLLSYLGREILDFLIIMHIRTMLLL